MRSVVLMLLFVFATPANAEEPTPEQRARIELVSARTEWFVGESPVVTIRVFVDREFFKQSAVPLFRREMDLPIQVRAPWLRDTEHVTPAPGIYEPRIAVGDKILQVDTLPDREFDGRVFTGLAIHRRLPAPPPGQLILAAPALRFAYATEFDEGFLDERLPVDRNDVKLDAAPLTLTVRELPTEGRPAGFHDAVGTFTLGVAPTRATLAVGETLSVRLTIRGTGNLATLTPPSLDGVAGLAITGSTDSRAANGLTREIVFEVTPTAAISEIPPFVLAYLEPGSPPVYREARSAAIALDVSGGASTPASATPDPTAAVDEAVVERDLTSVLLLLGGLLLVFLLLMLWAVRFRRRLQREMPVIDRAHLIVLREAGAKLRGLGDTDTLVEFLAIALRTTEPAVIAPGLATMLANAGVGADTARSTAQTIEAHVAARYGAPHAAPDPSAALINTLVTHFGPSA